jgi:tRNA(Ile)-lysidine synthase
VCLLYVLHEYRRKVKFDLTVVHVEHGIRGQESREDAEFTRQLCDRLGIAFCLVPTDVNKIAEAQGLTVEEAGRMERYRIFEEIRQRQHADRIAVAHNRNDQAETVLQHLVRGSGLNGLTGMAPVRGCIIRPLLFTGREEIETLLTQAQQTWRTDRTNLEQEYMRNRVRLSILPAMEQDMNEQAVSHIAQAADHLREVQEYLNRTAEQAAMQCLSRAGTDVIADLGALRQFDPLIQKEVLRKAMDRCSGLKDIGTVHFEALLDLTRKESGREVHLPGHLRVVREYGRLRFTGDRQMVRYPEYEVDLAEGVCELPAGGCRVHLELAEANQFPYNEIVKENKCTKWISYDTINRKLLFRTRRTGDYLVINSSGGRKKLKDYFIDQKIPRECRDQIWLLADGSHILWIMGDRISEAAKVKPETRTVLKIQTEEANA